MILPNFAICGDVRMLPCMGEIRRELSPVDVSPSDQKLRRAEAPLQMTRHGRSWNGRMSGNSTREQCWTVP